MRYIKGPIQEWVVIQEWVLITHLRYFQGKPIKDFVNVGIKAEGMYDEDGVVYDIMKWAKKSSVSLMQINSKATLYKKTSDEVLLPALKSIQGFASGGQSQAELIERLDKLDSQMDR